MTADDNRVRVGCRFLDYPSSSPPMALEEFLNCLLGSVHARALSANKNLIGGRNDLEQSKNFLLSPSLLA